jgi:exodeoxyribonuclease V alpha subunit
MTEFADLPLWAAARREAPPELPELLRELFPQAGPRLRRLYHDIHSHSGLLATDFYTIRDLLELSGYAEREPLHALLLALLLALDEGSLCVELSRPALARRLAVPGNEDEADFWAGQVLQALDADTFPNLIGSSEDDSRPVVLHRLGERSYLYFQKYLRSENLLRGALLRRLAEASAGGVPDNAAEVLHEVLVDRPRRIDGQPLVLNRDQRLAVGLALVRRFVIVSGGPGTGKTSIVFTLLRSLVRCGYAAERIALAAPTGRAAQRLTDSLRAGLADLAPPAGSPDASLDKLVAQTLHQLLRFHPRRGTFGHHAENLLPYDVVVVDEVSMVGLVLMAQLLQALAPETRLVLLGDKDQLPSVEAGAVLANLVPGDIRPTYSPEVRARLGQWWDDLDMPAGDAGQPLCDALVVLEANYRSQPQIQEIARSVNRQQVEVVASLPRDGEDRGRPLAWSDPGRQGCFLIEQGVAERERWHRLLMQWAEQHYLSPAGDSYADLVGRCRLSEEVGAQRDVLERLFRLLDAARVLTLVREGAWGCVGINRFLEQLLRPRLDRGGRGSLFAGAPILITRNDHDRELFNGDVGLALRSRDGYRVVFRRQTEFRALSADSLPAHELAFALTVHKSQGSEYGRVLLVLPPEGGRRLLTKEMIYTGITRARHLAVIAAPADVLAQAIARRVERESALLG